MLWGRDDVAGELDRRVADCLTRTEVVVDYYRIGYRFAFRLPLAERPQHFPTGVLGGDRPYPWLIWLGWQLEERWRALALAVRFGRRLNGRSRADTRPEELLTAELSALAQWDSFDADYNGAGLVTASFAAVCTEILEHIVVHDASLAGVASAVARRILDESVAPWYERTWQDADLTSTAPGDMQNIACITLFRAAQLADAAKHGRAQTYQAKAAELYTAWLAARYEPEPMTEGPAYDGYVLDAMTEWLAARPDAHELRAAGRCLLAPIPPDWARSTLPGRPDVLAPIGDVEPQMTQWVSAAVRLCLWYEEARQVGAWLRTLPLNRLASGALPAAYEFATHAPPANPLTGAHLQPSTATLRAGWGSADPVVVVGASRTPVGHLHLDCGQVVLGWHRRWWITDPGYQQYRLGPERDFTIGPTAHNPPVIDGIAQSIQGACVGILGREAGIRTDEPPGVELDLTRCYRGLPIEATVTRQVRLLKDGVTVADYCTGLNPGTVLETSWHADPGLDWAFLDGAVRLGGGGHALWIFTGTADAVRPIGASNLLRHPGTRGSLRLDHRVRCVGSDHLGCWVFLLDHAAGWQVPRDRADQVITAIGGWHGKR